MSSCRVTLSKVQLVLCRRYYKISVPLQFYKTTFSMIKKIKKSLKRFLSLIDNERKCQVLGWYFSVLLSLVGIRVRIMGRCLVGVVIS